MTGNATPQSSGETSQHGRRLLVHIVDDRAKNEPNREWVSIPRSSNPQDGWKKITYKQAANAINRLAHKITEMRAGMDALPGAVPTLAYIGPNDARYLVVCLGAVKAGCQALFISPRNSQEGQLNLFEKTDCRVLAFDAAYKSTVLPWLQEREMFAIMVPLIDEWFPDEYEPFPYTKTFEAEWDPLVVLHTSGSTGLPKPIVVRQGMVAIADKFHDLPEWQGTQNWIRGAAERATRFFVPSE